MKNIKKCPLFIILFSSGVLFTLLAAGGLRTIYQTQQFEWQKEPLLAVVFRGLNEEIYPWQLMTEGNDNLSSNSEAGGESGGEDMPGDATEPDATPTPTPTATEVPKATNAPQATTPVQSPSPTPSPSPSPTPYVRPTPMRESTYEEYTSHISADIYGDAGALHAAEYEFVNVDESYFDDALFIGDSRTVGLRDYSDLSQHADFLCETSLTVHKVFKHDFKGKGTLEEVLQAKEYGKIYLMVGINELGTGTTEDFMAKYTEVVEKLKELEPEAKIIIQANMHVAAERNESDAIFNNGNISARNHAIATLADNQQIFYIDVNEAVCDENGCLSEEYTYDQIHLLGKYNDLWKQFLLSHGIQEETVPEETE